MFWKRGFPYLHTVIACAPFLHSEPMGNQQSQSGSLTASKAKPPPSRAGRAEICRYSSLDKVRPDTQGITQLTFAASLGLPYIQALRSHTLELLPYLL